VGDRQPASRTRLFELRRTQLPQHALGVGIAWIELQRAPVARDGLLRLPGNGIGFAETVEGVGGFGEFLWFEGTCDPEGDSGQWILNHSSQFPEPMLEIDWTRDSEKIGNIKYTYIRELDNDRVSEPFKNSYIEYGLTSNTLDAFYNVHFYESVVLKTFVDVNIEWSTTVYNGRVKAFHHYYDNEWHCWDGNGNDTSCPQ